jgi:hypothetical protein
MTFYRMNLRVLTYQTENAHAEAEQAMTLLPFDLASLNIAQVTRSFPLGVISLIIPMNQSPSHVIPARGNSSVSIRYSLDIGITILIIPMHFFGAVKKDAMTLTCGRIWMRIGNNIEDWAVFSFRDARNYRAAA